MKKSTIYVLIAVFLIFAAFVAGFYIGRNIGSDSVQLSTSATTPSAPSSSTRVNINTATAEELMTLPGIGQTLAERIIAYRTLHGDFHSTADIGDVEGIGENTLQEILPYITIGG